MTELEAGVANLGRNPDWSRDETILLMDLYLSAPRAGQTHPEVKALSILLRAAGQRDGRTTLMSFRNPAGVAMRLRNFGRHDPNAPFGRNSGLRPGGAIDVEVWREFGGKRDALAAEVARIRRSIASYHWRPGARSSRGPVPSFGERTSLMEDGKAGVYLLLIDGPVSVLAPGVAGDEARALVKIGRTADLNRRMAELASGMPPGAAIRYVPIGLRTFASATKAHAFERALLDLCDHEGWSLGGEFAYVPLDDLRHRFSGSIERVPQTFLASGGRTSEPVSALLATRQGMD